MIQFIVKLLIIGAIVGGYDWLVSPFPLQHGQEQPLWVLAGWLVVVCIVYLTWRLEWTNEPVQRWRVVEDKRRLLP